MSQPLSVELADLGAKLKSWSAEADGFRAAALVTSRGEAPSSRVVGEAEAVHDGLLTLLEETDTIMAGLSAGSPEFGQILRLQTIAVGLLESIGNSLDRLESRVPSEVAAPRQITHEAA